MFGAPADYKTALVEMEQSFLRGLISDLKLDGRAEETIHSHIARGDARTEISLALN
jgi:hypothetical protein